MLLNTEDHNAEVPVSVIFLIAANRSTHTTTQKLVTPLSKLMTIIMLGGKVK